MQDFTRERSSMQADIKTARSQIEDDKQAMGDMRGKLEVAQAMIAKYESREREIDTKTEHAVDAARRDGDAKASKLEARIKLLENDVKQKDLELSNKKEEFAKLKGQYDTLDTAASEYRTREQNLMKQIEQLNDKLRNVELEHSRTFLDVEQQRNATVREIESKLAQVQQTLSINEERNIQLQHDNDLLKDENVMLMQNIRDLEHSMDTTEQHRQHLEAVIDDKNDAIAKMVVSMETMKQDADAARMEYIRMSEDLSQLSLIAHDYSENLHSQLGMTMTTADVCVTCDVIIYRTREMSS